MRTIYKRHTIDVNSQPSGEIVYDVYDSRQCLLAGFSRTDVNEQSVLERMKSRVDNFIQEAPISSFTK